MKKRILILVGLLGLHLLLLFNLQFTAWPEMFSFPYLINKGFLIYKDFHHAYQPLLTFILSGIYSLFGIKLEVLQIFTWSIILLNDFLIFLISLQLFGKKIISFLPLIIYIMFQPALEGNMLWYDLATIPFLLGATYLVLLWQNKSSSWHLLGTGILLSLTILVKQQSILLVFPFLLFLGIKKISFRDFLKFVLGGILPVVLLLFYILSKNIFKEYFFWTFTFPLYWLPRIPGYSLLPTKNELLRLFLLIVPFSYLFLMKLKMKKKQMMIFLLVILAALFLQAFPRFSFFHLQPFLVVYVLALTLIVSIVNKNYWIIILPVVFSGLIFWSINLWDIGQPARFYGQEELELSSLINNVTQSSEKIYLLGPHGLIYVLSDRVPPKPWIENYVWHFEIPGMQEKMLASWRADPPKIILWNEPQPGDWYKPGTYQPEKITEWIKLNYDKKEEVTSRIWLWRLK
jgi:hypothetical protein